MKRNIAILQPEIPHYREEFFEYVFRHCEKADIYVYNSFDSARKQGFNIVTHGIGYISNKKFHGCLIYNPWPFLSNLNSATVL